MASYTGATRTTSRQFSMALVGAAALALAALTGVGGYQFGVHNRGAARQAVVTRQVQPSAPESGEPASSAALSRGYAGVRPTSERPSVILVGGSDQTGAVAQEIEAANVIRAEMGVAPLQETIQQGGASGVAATVLRTVTDENLTRLALGLPEIQVQDLRPVSAVATTTPGVTSGLETQPTLVLVSTADQAQRAEQGIEEADVIRATRGVGPLPKAVMPVTSAEEMDTWTRTIADENLTREALGLPDIMMEDLRN